MQLLPLDVKDDMLKWKVVLDIEHGQTRVSPRMAPFCPPAECPLSRMLHTALSKSTQELRQHSSLARYAVCCHDCRFAEQECCPCTSGMEFWKACVPIPIPSSTSLFESAHQIVAQADAERGHHGIVVLGLTCDSPVHKRSTFCLNRGWPKW